MRPVLGWETIFWNLANIKPETAQLSFNWETDKQPGPCWRGTALGVRRPHATRSVAEPQPQKMQWALLEGELGVWGCWRGGGAELDARGSWGCWDVHCLRDYMHVARVSEPYTEKGELCRVSLIQ